MLGPRCVQVLSLPHNKCVAPLSLPEVLFTSSSPYSAFPPLLISTLVPILPPSTSFPSFTSLPHSRSSSLSHLGGRGRFPTSKIQLLILGVPLIAFFQNGTAEEAFSLPCCNEFLPLPSKYHHEVATHIVPVHTTTRGM